MTEKIEITTKAIQALPTKLDPTLKTIMVPQLPSSRPVAPLDFVSPTRSALVSELARKALKAGRAMTELGVITVAYFKTFTTHTSDVVTTFGIDERGGRFFIGDTEVTFDGNYIVVGSKTIDGTPGLW